MPAIWSLKNARDYINANIDMISKKESVLVNKAIDELSKIKNIKIYNRNYNRVPTFCFNIEGTPSDEVVKHLSDHNICVRGGIHCAILAHETIGTVKSGAVRVSLNAFNSITEITELINAIREM